MVRPATTENWDEAPDGATRVLVECPPEQTPDAVARVLRREGYEVRVCEGPDRRHECPMLTRGDCSLVSGADVVVNLFGATDPHTAPVLGALTDDEHTPPIVTEMTGPELRRRSESDDWWFDRDRVHIVETPLRTATLIAAVQESLEHKRHVDTPCGSTC